MMEVLSARSPLPAACQGRAALFDAARRLKEVLDKITGEARRCQRDADFVGTCW